MSGRHDHDEQSLSSALRARAHELEAFAKTLVRASGSATPADQLETVPGGPLGLELLAQALTEDPDSTLLGNLAPEQTSVGAPLNAPCALPEVRSVDPSSRRDLDRGNVPTVMRFDELPLPMRVRLNAEVEREVSRSPKCHPALSVEDTLPSPSRRRETEEKTPSPSHGSDKAVSPLPLINLSDPVEDPVLVVPVETAPVPALSADAFRAIVLGDDGKQRSSHRRRPYPEETAIVPDQRAVRTMCVSRAGSQVAHVSGRPMLRAAIFGLILGTVASAAILFAPMLSPQTVQASLTPAPAPIAVPR